MSNWKAANQSTSSYQMAPCYAIYYSDSCARKQQQHDTYITQHRYWYACAAVVNKPSSTRSLTPGGPLSSAFFARSTSLALSSSWRAREKQSTLYRSRLRSLNRISNPNSRLRRLAAPPSRNAAGIHGRRLHSNQMSTDRTIRLRLGSIPMSKACRTCATSNAARHGLNCSGYAARRLI